MLTHYLYFIKYKIEIKKIYIKEFGSVKIDYSFLAFLDEEIEILIIHSFEIKNYFTHRRSTF